MKLFHAMMMVLLLVACHRQPDKYVIGVSQCSEDIWRDKLNRELKAGEYFNDSLEVRLASANDDSRKQVAQINRFVDDGVDLIIVAPNQYQSITTAIERAYDRGIPVILYDRKVNTEKYTASIGADNYGIGKAMGRFVGHRLGGRGRVVEIRGLEGSSPAVERHAGFVDGLKAFPEVKLVASEAGDWKEESGSRAMDKILSKTQTFDYVFGQNDRMAWGAYMALKRRGMERMARYAGVDGLATEGGGLELVCDSVLEATSLYPTKGGEVLALAMKVLQRKKYDRENMLQTTIVTRDNAELLLMEAKETERQDHNLDMLHGKVDKYLAQYNNQRIFTSLSVGIVILMVVMVLNIYRAYITKSRLSMKLEERNAELQRLSKEVEDMTRAQLMFFTNVSHELRTPLTLVADPVDRLLESEELKGDSRLLLQMVQRNVNVLRRLVSEILDFRKIQNEKMTLRMSQFKIVEALQAWCSDFEPVASRKGIALKMQVEIGEDSCMTADRGKLQHIYSNLMNNALKYTSCGGTITTWLCRDAQRYIIKVHDTGVGIDESDIGNVFGRFYQAKNAMGGTGIGLAIVEALTKLHGGEVHVESKKGVGTCFTIAIPESPKAWEAQAVGMQEPECEQVEGAPSLLAEVGQEASVSALQHLSDIVSVDTNDKPEVLIIDDNDDVRSYLHSVMKEHYHVTEAADGRQGLALARRLVPDAVVCDVMMPVMDGLELTRQLKADTATSHIPVVMLTARTLDDHKAEGYEYGADSYLTKPFHTRVLLARIDNLLNSRRLLRNIFASSDSIERQAGYEGEGTERALAAKTGDKDLLFIARLRELIQKNLSDSGLSVEKLGAEIGLSRVQLYRKVKALTGQSPVELLRTARLQRGKRLLETTDMSISEVAYDVGFTSPSYFTKCFKDEFGKSPNEWRA